MPRLVAATPKYRHHRASGQAIVTIAGRDRYLGPYKSKAWLDVTILTAGYALICTAGFFLETYPPAPAAAARLLTPDS